VAHFADNIVVDVDNTTKKIKTTICKTILREVEFKQSESDGQQYYPGFSPGCPKLDHGIWSVNGKTTNNSENDADKNVARFKFYIPKQDFTQLLPGTNIECSSFVLQCTITASSELDIEGKRVVPYSLNKLTRSVQPEILLTWTTIEVQASDEAMVTYAPAEAVKALNTTAQEEAFAALNSRSYWD
jgi:hypothetical protein